MDKDTKINYFIYLLSGCTIAGEMERFYQQEIETQWTKEIIGFLIDTGRIRELIWLKKIDPLLTISQEGYRKMVDFNLRKLNFIAAISAAQFIGVPSRGQIYQDILKKTLEYYVANQDKEVFRTTESVIRAYREYYEIPGLKQQRENGKFTRDRT